MDVLFNNKVYYYKYLLSIKVRIRRFDAFNYRVVNILLSYSFLHIDKKKLKSNYTNRKDIYKRE